MRAEQTGPPRLRHHGRLRQQSHCQIECNRGVEAGCAHFFAQCHRTKIAVHMSMPVAPQNSHPRTSWRTQRPCRRSRLWVTPGPQINTPALAAILEFQVGLVGWGRRIAISSIYVDCIGMNDCSRPPRCPARSRPPPLPARPKSPTPYAQHSLWLSCHAGQSTRSVCTGAAALPVRELCAHMCLGIACARVRSTCFS